MRQHEGPPDLAVTVRELEREVQAHLDEHVARSEPREAAVHAVLCVGRGGAWVDVELAERAELRLEHEQVGLDRGGYLVRSGN